MKYKVTVRESSWYAVEVEAVNSAAAVNEAARKVRDGEVTADEGRDLDAYSVEHDNTVIML